MDDPSDNLQPLPAKLIRTEGVTPAERRLKRLCDRSFLSLWSYANVYRNQGMVKGEGKEICDVLVVFGDHVLIFSDKHCEFPSTGDIGADWSKWYRRAVGGAAKRPCRFYSAVWG